MTTEPRPQLGRCPTRRVREPQERAHRPRHRLRRVRVAIPAVLDHERSDGPCIQKTHRHLRGLGQRHQELFGVPAVVVNGDRRTIEIQAGRQTIIAADPIPDDLHQALDAINRPN
jgi:hypothetical protein